MKKRILSLVLALAMCLSFATFSVSADTTKPVVSLKTFATEEDAINLTNEITGVEKNSTFYVALTVNNLEKVYAIVVPIAYNEEEIKPVSFDGNANIEFTYDNKGECLGIPLDGTNGVKRLEDFLPGNSSKNYKKAGKNGCNTYVVGWMGDHQNPKDLSEEKTIAVYKFKALKEGAASLWFPYKETDGQTENFDRRAQDGAYFNTSSSNFPTGTCYQKENNVVVNPVNINITARSLATPENVALNERTVTWDAVTDAANYTVNVTGENAEGSINKTYTTNTNSFVIPANDVEYGKLNVTVIANSNDADVNSSKASTPVAGTIYKELSAPANVKWQETTVVWDVVPGATEYEVALYVNGGETPVTGYPKTITETSYDAGSDMEIPVTGSNSYVVKITAKGNPEYTSNTNATSSSSARKFYGNVKSVLSPVWEGKFAKWTANDDADKVKGYSVTVYKDGVELEPTVTTTATSADLSSYMTESGRYLFSVVALGKAETDGAYGDSAALTSPETIVSTPLSPVTSITWNERKITWTDDNNGIQRGYEITLYEKLEGEDEFTAKETSVYTGINKEFDFDRDDLIQVGEYKVSIKVLGDNVLHTDSETAFESDVKTFAARLTDPTAVDWSGDKAGSWTAGDSNAKSYVVRLYYNGVKICEKTSNTTSVTFNATEMCLPEGNYTFTVQAKAPGFSASKEVVSASSQTVSVTRNGNVNIKLYDDAECTTEITETQVGKTFYVAVSVENIGNIDSLSIPFKFDPHYVKVEDINGVALSDSALSKEELESGNKGIVLGELLKGNEQTNVSIIYDEKYPYVNNTNGLVVIYSYLKDIASNGPVEINAEKTIAIIRMQAVSMDETGTEFGFAVANNEGKPFDDLSLSGIEFFNGFTHIFANLPDPAVKINIGRGKIATMQAPVWNTTTLTWTKASGDHVKGYEIELYKDGGATPVATVTVDDPNAESYSMVQEIIANGYGSYTAKIKALGDGIGADDSDLSAESEAYVFFKRNNNSGGGRVPVKPDEPKPPVEDEKPEFTDIDGHWAEEDIIALVDLGIVEGYGDNTFRPDLGITRAEFTKLMVTSLGLEIDGENEYYDDTKEHWAKDYIAVGSEIGIVYGIGDNLFDPDRIITREQVAAIIHRMTGNVEADVADFTDRADVSDYAKPAVDYVAEQGIMIGFHDNSFRGQEYTTRAQMATVVARLIKADFFKNAKVGK